MATTKRTAPRATPGAPLRVEAIVLDMGRGGVPMLKVTEITGNWHVGFATSIDDLQVRLGVNLTDIEEMVA